MIKYLIDHGVDINTKYKLVDYNYHNSHYRYYRYYYNRITTKYLRIKTLLIHTIEKENESMMKYLIEHGADINIRYELYEFSPENGIYCNPYSEYEKKEIKPLLYIVCEKDNI